MDVISFSDSRLITAYSVSAIESLKVENGLLVGIEANGRQLTDCSGRHLTDVTLVPGFIDIHNHGGLGSDVNDGDSDGLLRTAAFLASRGVSAWLPTLVPDSDKNYRRAVDAIDELMIRQEGLPVAQAVGVHYEGVFASETMCGALRPEYFKRYTGKEISDLTRLRSGVHMITLAPEVDGGIELIAELVRQGWIVSIGHTNAGPEVLDKALEAGARHMTHFFNAMSGLHHRSVGTVGWGLSNPDVTFDIIADGVHVDPRVAAMAVKAKTSDKVTIISDSIAPTGLGDGVFDLWGGKVTVIEGRTRNDKGSIAGSVSTMLQGAKLMHELGFGYEEISKMTSRNPARLLGLEDSRGSIEVGKRADLVGLDREGNVAFTMIGGQMVHK
jgi:N-acetylglucosamine-6-phosphate deacetylase